MSTNTTAEDTPLLLTQKHETDTTIHFWKAATLLLFATSMFFMLILGLISSLYFQVKPLTPPTWPQQITFRQSVTTTNFLTSDDGLAWYDWNTKSFKSEHTNLWDTRCNATLLWVHKEMYLYNSTFCCTKKFNNVTLRPMAPNWLENHIYSGTAQRNNQTVRVWFSPIMSSIYYDTLDGVPVRWDNTPDIEIGGKGALTTTYTDVNLNPTIPAGTFNVSELCNTKVECVGINLCRQ